MPLIWLGLALRLVDDAPGGRRTSPGSASRCSYRLMGWPCAPHDRERDHWSRTSSLGLVYLFTVELLREAMDHPRVLFAAGVPATYRRFEVDGQARSGVPTAGQLFVAGQAHSPHGPRSSM